MQAEQAISSITDPDARDRALAGIAVAHVRAGRYTEAEALAQPITSVWRDALHMRVAATLAEAGHGAVVVAWAAHCWTLPSGCGRQVVRMASACSSPIPTPEHGASMSAAAFSRRPAGPWQRGIGRIPVTSGCCSSDVPYSRRQLAGLVLSSTATIRSPVETDFMSCSDPVI